MFIVHQRVLLSLLKRFAVAYDDRYVFDFVGDPQSVVKVFEETRRRGVLIGKGGLYANVIRTGLMLNSTKDTVDELIEALDGAFSQL